MFRVALVKNIQSELQKMTQEDIKKMWLFSMKAWQKTIEQGQYWMHVWKKWFGLDMDVQLLHIVFSSNSYRVECNTECSLIS